jgi:hypothetical protein
MTFPLRHGGFGERLFLMLTRLKKYLPGLVVVFLLCSPLFDETYIIHWMHTWAVLSALLVLPIGYQVAKNYSMLWGALISYTLFQTFIFFGGPPWYLETNVMIQQGLRLDMAYALLTFFVFIFLSGQGVLHKFLNPLVYASVALSILVLSGYFLGKNPAFEVPLFKNPSMTGSYIAMAAPLLPLWALPLSLIAIIAMKASVPTLAFFVGLSVRFAPSKKYLLVWPVLAAVYLSLFGVPNSSGRFHLWGEVFEWSKNHSFWILGTGLGSSRMLLQVIHPDPGSVFFSMHNDFLQLFFELGVVGTLLIVGICVRTLYLSWVSAPILGSVLATFIVMGANFPLHWPLHALFIASLLAFVFRTETPYNWKNVRWGDDLSGWRSS